MKELGHIFLSLQVLAELSHRRIADSNSAICSYQPRKQKHHEGVKAKIHFFIYLLSTSHMCQTHYLLTTAGMALLSQSLQSHGTDLRPMKSTQQCSELSKNTKDIRKEVLLREIKIVGICIVHYYYVSFHILFYLI